MSQRILIAETPQHIGETVKLQGWVCIRRDHGKLIFIELRDRSGRVQAVLLPEHSQAIETGKELRSEYVVEIIGKIKERPGKAKENATPTDSVEVEVESVAILARPSDDLPIDVSKPDLGLQLETLLEYRTLSLRNEKVRVLFETYSELLKAYDDTMRVRGFMEIKTPKILGSATEGGANVFKIKYFDQEAFLAQSPQFYKQAGVSAFERVFEIGTVFRAEPHFTARHVNEYTGLDAEMGFIDGAEDVMIVLEEVMQTIFRHIGTTCEQKLHSYGAVLPPDVAIPRIPLTEAIRILKDEYGKETENEDIDGEGERLISEYVQKTYGSDLVFLTRYPAHVRPFYSMPSANDPKYTETFDLLFRGIEIASGGQRIHKYQMLIENMKKKGLDPEAEGYQSYLDVFRFGIPPHGGFGLGSERIIQKLFGLASIKEAVLYPRDVKRLTP